jgi:hypothetical protein
VVEVFNAAASLSADADFSGTGCSSETVFGLSLIVYDANVVNRRPVNPLGIQCRPNGTGNIHNTVEVKPDLAGTLYIRVLPGGQTVSGAYSIRVTRPGQDGRVYLPILRK